MAEYEAYVEYVPVASPGDAVEVKVTVVNNGDYAITAKIYFDGLTDEIYVESMQAGQTSFTVTVPEQGLYGSVKVEIYLGEEIVYAGAVDVEIRTKPKINWSVVALGLIASAAALIAYKLGVERRVKH